MYKDNIKSVLGLHDEINLLRKIRHPNVLQLYEIFERARYTTLVDSYGSQTIIELANNEFDNLQKILEEDFDIVDIMKTINSPTILTDYMLSFSPFDRFPYYQDKLPTIPSLSSPLAFLYLTFLFYQMV